LKYLPAEGDPVDVPQVIPPRGRLTINLALEDPALASAAIATNITSDVPIISERVTYWPGPPQQWYEAHLSVGEPGLSRRWGLADGRVGGPEDYQTYILISNPNIQDATVILNVFRADGTTLLKQFTFDPMTRFNVHVNTMIPELANEAFSVRVDASVPVLVERSMYGNANGVIWATGTNVNGTRLP
jgi:hypothetical protein